MKTAPDTAVAYADLDHAHRLDAMGLAARSTVHELNNQMVAILGLAELLLDALPEDDARRLDVEDIRAAGGKVVAKTRELALMTRLLVPARL
jgi:signal transduction histidine kinase